ncbi:MFS transporter [Coraliomargarita sp. W4R53]
MKLPQPKLRPSYKWELLTLFWFANFVNQGDRQIFNSILPLIKEGLGTDDVHMGLVATIFTIVYGVCVPIAGWLGDRTSRKWLVCTSLLIFSFGTLLTGVGGGLVALIIFRSIATGAGESLYTPPAVSLIGQYHNETRGLAMAINQTSLYVGIVASSWIAAVIAERFGWRSAFHTFGGFGLVIAVILIFRLRNDPPDNSDSVEASKAPPIKEILGCILRKPSFYLLSSAFGCMVFVNVGFMTWMPTLLYEDFDLSLSTAAFQSVFLHHLFAFFGVLIGGWISDKQAIKRPVARLHVAAVGLLLGTPFIYLLGQVDSLYVLYAALAIFGFFRGVYDSNIFAALYEVIPPRYRSTATGLMISCAFGTGASAPLILGFIKQHYDLAMGLSLLSPAYFVGAVLIWISAFAFFKKDQYLISKQETLS